ncbi:MAG: DUF6151 family protein [Paracoccaceae bacterium]|nr:DUF6151 family protein [Paracoccaceae bacterium]
MRELTCRCGKMGWQVTDDAPGTHLVCYCADCQAFANHLDRSDWLNPAGGTDIFQTVPAHVAITKGAEHLACLRLGPKGLRRWYAGCCQTPIANTLPGPGLPFVGVVLPQGEDRFGPGRYHVQTTHARTPVRSHGTAAAGFGIMARAAMARLRGGGDHPFFDKDGTPRVTATVLTREERAAATPAQNT